MRKKDTTKKLQAVLIVAAMVAATTPVSAFAAEDFAEDQIQMEVEADEDTASVTTETSEGTGEVTQDADVDLFGDGSGSAEVQADTTYTAASLAELLNKNAYAIRPRCKDNQKVTDKVRDMLVGYTGLSQDAITVTVKSTEDASLVDTDGTIHYIQMDTLNSYTYSKNVACVFTIGYDGATADTKSFNVTVGWDQTAFKAKMQAEADTLTIANILGSNTSSTEVTSDLTLPQIMGTNARQVWSQVTWTSSDPDIIAIQSTGYDSLIDPKAGKITQPTNDTEVTLTATFKANDTILNDNVESVEDFGTIVKTFKVTVKGNGISGPTVADLKKEIEDYYLNVNNDSSVTNGGIHYYAGTKDSVEVSTDENKPNILSGDLQLPRYTRIKKNGEYVFANREITVTSSIASVATVNGYRVAVNLLQNADVKVSFTITLTRDGVSASKTIYFIVQKLDDNVLKTEKEFIEHAKDNIFDGIKGLNTDPKNITKKLTTFQELNQIDGKYVWVHNASEMTEQGIVADGYFDDPWEMEAKGYNRFRSSNPSVVAHENLVITKPASPTEVTITCWLTSEKYGSYYKYASNDEFKNKFKGLYRVEANVTLTIMPEKADQDPLESAIEAANDFIDSVVVGTNPGEYPQSAKDALQQAIDTATAILKSEPSEAEKQNAIDTLNAAVQACKDSQIPKEATVTFMTNLVSNAPGTRYTVTASGDTAATYGYDYKDKEYAKEVTVLDAAVALHRAVYGGAFTKDTARSYLDVAVSGGNVWFNKFMEMDCSSNFGFLVNDAVPTPGSYANNAVLSQGDLVTYFGFFDTTDYTDEYLHFVNVPTGSIPANTSFTLTLKGFKIVDGIESDTEKAGYTVTVKNKTTGVITTSVTNTAGQAAFTLPAGTYEAYVTGSSGSQYYVVPTIDLTVK